MRNAKVLPIYHMDIDITNITNIPDLLTTLLPTSIIFLLQEEMERINNRNRLTSISVPISNLLHVEIKTTGYDNMLHGPIDIIAVIGNIKVSVNTGLDIKQRLHGDYLLKITSNNRNSGYIITSYIHGSRGPKVVEYLPNEWILRREYVEDGFSSKTIYYSEYIHMTEQRIKELYDDYKQYEPDRDIYEQVVTMIVGSFKWKITIKEDDISTLRVSHVDKVRDTLVSVVLIIHLLQPSNIFGPFSILSVPWVTIHSHTLLEEQYTCLKDEDKEKIYNWIDLPIDLINNLLSCSSNVIGIPL